MSRIPLRGAGAERMISYICQLLINQFSNVSSLSKATKPRCSILFLTLTRVTCMVSCFLVQNRHGWIALLCAAGAANFFTFIFAKFELGSWTPFWTGSGFHFNSGSDRERTAVFQLEDDKDIVEFFCFIIKHVRHSNVHQSTGCIEAERDRCSAEAISLRSSRVKCHAMRCCPSDSVKKTSSLSTMQLLFL